MTRTSDMAFNRSIKDITNSPCCTRDTSIDAPSSARHSLETSFVTRPSLCYADEELSPSGAGEHAHTTILSKPTSIKKFIRHRRFASTEYATMGASCSTIARSQVQIVPEDLSKSRKQRLPVLEQPWQIYTRENEVGVPNAGREVAYEQDDVSMGDMGGLGALAAELAADALLMRPNAPILVSRHDLSRCVSENIVFAPGEVEEFSDQEPEEEEAAPNLALLKRGAEQSDMTSRYDILGVLGHGSFGAVYRAVQKGTGVKVAIKTMHCGSSENAERASQEGSVAMELECEYIVKCIECNITPCNDVWIVTEFCGGGDLNGRSSLSQPNGQGVISAAHARNYLIAESQLWLWTTQLLRGLALFAQKNIIHGDIKPANSD